MTISSKLTPKRAKKVATNVILLMEKMKIFTEMKNEAKDKEGKELNDAGYGILKKMFDFAFKEEYDLIITIVADLYDVTFEKAEDLPLEKIYDFVAKDLVFRSFFPQFAILEQQTQLDISQNQEG